MAELRRIQTTLAHLKSKDDMSTTVPTPQQMAQYENEGFFVVRGLLSSSDIEKYKKRFLQYCDGELEKPSPTMIIMKDVNLKGKEKKGEKAITKIQDFEKDDTLFDYCRNPKITQYVRGIIGDDIKSIHTMLINKPPDLGMKSSRHPLHQDLYYFPLRPANKIVASWTAMQTINRENGCLVVIPGSHKQDLLCHGYPQWKGGVNKMYHGIMDLPKLDGMIHLEMELGDTVFFHPLLIHGSGANNSHHFRKAISCHYANLNCEYIDVTGTIQEGIAAEVMEVAKRKTGMEIDFLDVWRAKSRVVKTSSSNQ